MFAAVSTSSGLKLLLFWGWNLCITTSLLVGYESLEQLVQSNLTERRNTDLGEEHDKVLVWCMFSWHLVSNLEMINTFSPKTNLLDRSCYDGCFKYHRNVTGWSGKIVWIFLKEAIKNIRQTLLLHLSITRLDSKSTAAKSFLTSASLVHAVVSPRVRVEFSWVSSEASSSAASVVQSICDDYWSPAHFVFSWFIPQFKPVFNFHQLIFYICSVHTTFLWFLSVTQNLTSTYRKQNENLQLSKLWDDFCFHL